MKKILIILVSFYATTCLGQEFAILEEVKLRDAFLRDGFDTLLTSKLNKCVSTEKAPYFVIDYYPATLASDEFQIGVYPAFLSPEEFSNLGYYVVIKDIPFVLPRDIPKWFYNKTGKKRLFTILFDREMEAKWQAEYDVPIIDDREFIRSIPWILIRGENQTLKQPIDTYLCFCGKER